MSSRDGPGFAADDPLNLLEAGFLTGAGRYTLTSLIGYGDASAVWRATDSQVGEEVALKFFSASVVSDSRAIARIRREAQRSRKLSHPNIVRTFDLFSSAEDAPFLVMELVEGKTLEQIARESADELLPWEFI